MRPSQPVRHFTCCRNARCCSWACRALLGLPLRGMTTFRTEIVQVILDAGLAVAAVGGHRSRLPAGAADDAFDSGFQPRSIDRVARLHVVVEDDAVIVVDQLSLVAELDRFPEPALSDWPGVGIVQADLPRRTVWDPAGEPLPGLLDDLPGRVQQFGQIVDRPD